MYFTTALEPPVVHAACVCRKCGDEFVGSEHVSLLGDEFLCPECLAFTVLNRDYYKPGLVDESDADALAEIVGAEIYTAEEAEES